MSELSFEGYKLSEDIVRALGSLQYEQPTEVQSKVIPGVLEKQDLIVKSQTGSGKTAAFGIPICDQVDWSENKPQALILTPTRELAVQVKDDITNIGRFKRIKATVIYGKESFKQQAAELKQKSHIVVGTPGRVLDHIQRGTMALDCVEYLVIDEADHMLSMGFIEQVEAIIKELPRNRVTLLFSATLPEDIEKLCRKHMKEPMRIEIISSGMTTNTIQHSLIEVREADKFDLLRNISITENPDSCIIFCRTQDQVNKVHLQLVNLEYATAKIHGGMEQEDRFAVMNDFQRGAFRYLVATDVAARGIDIDNITHIINYDFPMEKESYVHRTGRTARAGKGGKAISFVTPHENKWVNEVQDYVGFNIPRVDAPTYDEIANKKTAFIVKSQRQPAPKQAKSEQLNKEIMKLYFNGGKKKKLRAVDFVGTIARIEGVTADDIGIITIQDLVTYVEILNGKGPLVLQTMKETTIKGKQLKVYIANK
jgi:ATP-dependent RNA helicase DeaD